MSVQTWDVIMNIRSTIVCGYICQPLMIGCMQIIVKAGTV
jgi:hypothetical protein